MNIDKSNTSIPVGTDKITVNRQDVSEYTCTLNKISDYVVANVPTNTLPYKSYVASITQTGTAAPVATVLENTLGGTVGWVRLVDGQYIGTLTGAFTTNKTACFIASRRPDEYVQQYEYFIENLNINNIQLVSAGPSGAYDSLLLNKIIEIRVYN